MAQRNTSLAKRIQRIRRDQVERTRHRRNLGSNPVHARSRDRGRHHGNDRGHRYRAARVLGDPQDGTRGGAQRHASGVVLWLTCAALSACGIIDPNLDAPNRRPLDPIPGEYHAWYDEVQACVEQNRPFHQISWYVSDELFLDGVEMGGVWRGPATITMSSDYVLRERAVKSEMIHFAMGAGDAIHGTGVFDRCTPGWSE